MTKTQILKLRPGFMCGNMEIIDWFEIQEGSDSFSIKSALRHADGETKSPYHYDDCVVGKNAKKIALQRFSDWWNSLNTAQ